MRVLVLGAGGMLGRDLVAAGPPTVTVIPLTHAELDITDRMALASRVAAERPNVILNDDCLTRQWIRQRRTGRPHSAPMPKQWATLVGLRRARVSQ